MNRIFFVGIHNKPGMFPLDSKTKTGKIVDTVIAILGPKCRCVKSNIFNVDHLPDERDDQLDLQWAENWAERMVYRHGDIIVCLGDTVQEVVDRWRSQRVSAQQRPRIVKVKHPSSIWANADRWNWANDTARAIREA